MPRALGMASKVESQESRLISFSLSAAEMFLADLPFPPVVLVAYGLSEANNV